MARTMFRLPGARGIRGSVDIVTATHIDGWVMNRACPQKRTGVELRVGEPTVASGLADLFRSDLLAIGLGDGRYGFQIAIPPSLSDADRQAVRVIEILTGHDLSSTPLAVPGLSLPVAEETSDPAPAPTPEDEHEDLYASLLDRDYYAAQLAERGDVAEDDFVSHYRTTGWKDGLNPHPLFDTAYYLAAGPEEVDGDPLLHFATTGQVSYRPTHPLLDIAYYHARRPDVLAAGLHPLVHYIRHGQAEKVPTSPPAAEEVSNGEADTGPEDEHEDLYASLIDTDYYAAQLAERGDVEEGDFVSHYRTTGWKDGLNPHPLFDTAHYLAAGPEEVDGDPLLHFATTGQVSYRPTHPLLDIAYYHARRPDVLAAGLHPLVHYIRHGQAEKVPTSTPAVAEATPDGEPDTVPGPDHADFYASLLDKDYYAAQLADRGWVVAEDDFVSHYRTTGWKEGLNPHPLFDTAHYLAAGPEEVDGDPLLHFATTGQVRYRPTHPLLDIAYYHGLRPDVLAAGLHPLVHYIRYGHAENAPTSPPDVLPGSEHADLYASLLDRDYYAVQLADRGRVVAEGDFVSHYRTTGWKEGLNPHPLFDTAYYLAAGPEDIAVDPLWHFATTGQYRYRPTHPLLDIAYYHDLRPDVLAVGLHPLAHYIRFGHLENVPTSPLFDVGYYNNQFVRPDSQAGTTTTPVLHYLSFGWREGRKPHRSFDPALFRRVAKLDPKVDPYTAFLSGLMARQAQKGPPATPRYSFVILNLNKTLLTLQCLHFLALHTDMARSEVVVVDNGSNWDEFSLLCQYAAGARIVRSDRNVGFGEGNNLGVEVARGEYAVFLNNDAFVTEGWLEPLIDAIESDPEIGAAGPKFLYADGRLQEAGATISPCGTPVQRGKGLNPRDPLFNEPMIVDYCSAATLAMRAESFRRVLGYDLCWDPAYYEDVDLCMKLRLIGERTVYVPTSEVIHLEHQTAGDRNLGLRMDGLTQINRVKFIARWSRFLQGRSDGSVERRLLPEFAAALPPPRAEVRTKRIGLFSPYPLTPGGGERYLLSLAAALREDYDCTLLTADHYSAIRLATLARELELPLDHVTIRQRKHAPGEFFDVFVCMSNEVLPAVPGMGRLNIFLCQFPFSMAPGAYAQYWDNLRGYDAMMVYSRFVAEHVDEAAARLGLTLPPVHILCPAIPQVSSTQLASVPERERGAGEPFRIVNVGRFTLGGHCKRQDTMVEAFRELVAATKRPVELHLAGSLGDSSADRAYLTSLHRAAQDLPVSFHVNATAEEIHDLYRGASVYWHMTGAKDDVKRMPERFEHFGITVGEAMSAGAIPITLRHGGPGEIIRDGRDGFLVSDAEELRDKTLALMDIREEDVRALRDSARARSTDFSMDRFAAHLRAIIAEPQVPKIDPALR